MPAAITPICSLLLTTILVWSAQVAAATGHPHADIVNSAQQFLQQSARNEGKFELEIQVSPLDPRLQLAACHTPLQAYAPPGFRATGNTNVGIRCTGQQPWNILIPARIRAYTHIVVSARPVAKGSTFSSADITLKREDISALSSGYFTDPSEVIGKTAKMPIMLEHVITPINIAPALVVKRGDNVIIVASSDDYEIRTDGTAMQDGAVGDSIIIINRRSQRRIEGIVVAPAEVHVKM